MYLIHFEKAENKQNQFLKTISHPMPSNKSLLLKNPNFNTDSLALRHTKPLAIWVTTMANRHMVVAF